MRKRVVLLSVCFVLALQYGFAQNLKWVDKARRAVFSVYTYDKEDKLLNSGNAFYVTTDGVAMADFSLFKGAHRAIAVSGDGNKMPVLEILGADGMYDVVKFRVETPKKGVVALNQASNSPAVGDVIYLLPYSTQKGACLQGKINSLFF